MILAINSATPSFSMALLDVDGSLISETTLSPGMRKFIHFIPAIQDMLFRANHDIREIKALAVIQGPGSFTGLRVGLATAKGLCQGLDVPIMGFSALEAMAYQLPFAPTSICALIESRRSEVFAALFHWSGKGALIRDLEDTAFNFIELCQIIDRPTVFIGNDFKVQAEAIKDSIGGQALLAPAFLWDLRASAVGMLAVQRMKTRDYDDLRDLVPTYLRPPDIRPNPYPFAV